MNYPTDHEPTEMGIVEELARDDVERKKFLKMAGKGIGSAVAASGLAAFIAACGSSKTTSTAAPATNTGSGNTGTSTTASNPFGTGDLGIVNYALTLEYLESQFYAKVVAANLFTGSMQSTVKTFGEEEDQHVAALEKVATSLGKAAAKPTGKFSLTSASAVATLAATVENVGAAAYLGQAGNIKSPEILAAALSIHSVEARHAALLNYATKQNPTPNGAFGKPMTMAEVLKVVTPFIA